MITAFAFSRTLGYGFLDWDDRGLLLDHDRYHGLDPERLSWMFSTLHAGHYQPLTWISYALNHAVGGMNPWGYHAVNVLLHALTSALLVPLFLALWRLGLPPVEGESSRRRLGVAVAAALLYAVHPLRVESVAWVTERRDVLSGFLLVASTVSWLRAMEGGARARRWKMGAFALFTLSLLAKGWGITFPVILLALDAWPLRRLGGGKGRWLGPEVHGVWREKIPFFVLSAAAAAVAPFAQSHAGVLVRTGELGILDRLAMAANGLVHYVVTTLVPVDLVPLVERPVDLDPFAARFLVAAAVVTVVVTAILRLSRRHPGLAAAAVAYVTVLAPVLGFVQSGPQLVADRYTYLAAIPLSALMGGAGLLALRRRPARAGLAFSAVALLAMALSAATWQQSAFWESDRALWTRTLEVHPDSRRAALNLGVVHEKVSEHDDAERCHRRALELHPDYTLARLNLAAVLRRTGRERESESQNREAFRRDPESLRARGACAFDDLLRGEVTASLETFLSLLDLEPDHHRWHRGAGLALSKLERPREAREQLETAVRLAPGDGEDLTALATLEASTGHRDVAVRILREGLRDEPSHGQGYFTLGSLLAESGEWDDAEDALRTAERHLPASPEAPYNLAIVLVRLGRTGEAIEHLEEAARRAPGDEQIRQALETLRSAPEGTGGL
ncbi:MAG: tetratricopeptide repeat protein [Planctomycetota bacterium]